MSTENLSIHDQVREYYGRTLEGSDDLKTDACCCATEAPPKYVLDVMPLIDDEIIARFYGCGSPIPPALDGCTVLDLGCGTGRDVYVASKLVGPQGHVIGLDMTDEQLAVARAHQQQQAETFGFDASNVEFKKGYIEDLAEVGIADNSVDVVISNCVINLSPFKEQVFSEIYRVLKPGGELYFSDVFADHRMPDDLKSDPVLRGECLGGALYVEDFKRIMRSCGWETFRWCAVDPLHVGDFAIQTKVGFIGFTSRTVRAIKAPDLEQTEENYAQVATYNGTMLETPRYFDFDCDVRFRKGRPLAVSGNVAAMLQASRFGKHFSITTRRLHCGAFDMTQDDRAVQAQKMDKPLVADDMRRISAECGIEPFDERVGEPSLLQSGDTLATMQVNIGYACNLACDHCYLDCSPKREEHMERSTMEACLKAFETGGYSIMDITGGSPEMNPHLEWFMREAASRGQVIVRSNLTLLTRPEYAHFVQAFADAGVRVVGSLPYYREDAADSQRGKGVFARCIAGVKALNEVGYGNGDLVLDLVYNVAGPYLAPPQELLQEAYAQVLTDEQGVTFNDLLAFNNWPLGRFGYHLLEHGKMNEYMELLADNFNALAVSRMMCRDMVNIDYDGMLYDCEVNHVVGLPMTDAKGNELSVFDIVDTPLTSRTIATSAVCYACAAGSGSSCGGSLV